MYRLSYLKNHLPQPGRRLFPYLSKARTRTMHQLLLHHTLNPCVKKWELFLFQKRRLKINVRPKGRKKHPLRWPAVAAEEAAH